MKTIFIFLFLLCSMDLYAWQTYKGTYQRGNTYGPTNVLNPYSPNSMKYKFHRGSNTSYGNLYDQEGNFSGTLNDNTYDIKSINNPYGTYGNPYSPKSPNNIMNKYKKYNIIGD